MRPSFHVIIYVFTTCILLVSEIVLLALGPKGSWTIPFIPILFVLAYRTAFRVDAFSSLALFLASSLAVCLGSIAVLSTFFYVLRSDSRHYDLIARLISENVYWLRQLNPLDYKYVIDIGLKEGSKISQPGFYKLLGLLYSVAKELDIDPLLTIIHLNVWSFAIGALLLFKTIEVTGVSSRVQMLLWLYYVCNPWLLEQIVIVRKDLMVIMLTLIGIHWIAKAKLKKAIIVAVFLIPFRYQASLLVMIMVCVYWLLQKKTVKYRLARSIFFGACFLGPAIIFLFLPTPELSPETVKPFFIDREFSQTGGLSRYFEDKPAGAIIYAIAFPFPSLRSPEDLISFLRTIYSVVSYIMTYFAISAIFSFSKRGSNFFMALLYCFLMTFWGLLSFALGSLENLGFVIMEPRYKILWQALIVILAGYYFAGMQLPRGIARTSPPARQDRTTEKTIR